MSPAVAMYEEIESAARKPSRSRTLSVLKYQQGVPARRYCCWIIMECIIPDPAISPTETTVPYFYPQDGAYHSFALPLSSASILLVCSLTYFPSCVTGAARCTCFARAAVLLLFALVRAAFDGLNILPIIPILVESRY